MSNDIRAARIINAVSVGDELGIFEIERRLVPDFTQAGYLLPLDSIVEEIGEDQFIPGSLLYWPLDGHLYQFTSDLSAGTLYWRKDLFEEAGLAEPDSYERLLEASERLHDQNGVSGNAFEASNNGGVQRFVTFLWQNCGDFYTKEGELAFDREGSRQAVEDYAELNQYTPSGSHSWGNLDPINSYVAGRVAHGAVSGAAGLPGRDQRARYRQGHRHPRGPRGARRQGAARRLWRDDGLRDRVDGEASGGSEEVPEVPVHRRAAAPVRDGRAGPQCAADQERPGPGARAGRSLHHRVSRLGGDDP